ncbi:MAG: HYR domain-containing protein [Flavobacteriales bacterium]|nr:HYR domain-containing protein [Flavobacteriales bacterium]
MRKTLLGLLLISAATSGAFGQNICLRANNDFTSANGTNGVTNPKFCAKGDFNGDGILDVLTSNPNVTNVSSVSVFFGQGNGLFTFQDTVTITPSASNAQALAVADFNSDGKSDFVVVKRISTSSNVRVMVGDGTGNFNLYADLSVASLLLTDVVTGDFNNDGSVDIVTFAASSPGTLTFFANNGAGFDAGVNTAPTFTGLGYYAKAAQVDASVDNNLDVVITRNGSDRLTLMRGTGTGTFTTGFNILIGTAPRDLDLGDLNGDGFVDVAVAMSGSDSVHVVFTNGSGAVTSISRFRSGGDGPQSLSLVDIDNDGDKDIVVANLTDYVVGLLVNDGTGNFTLKRYEGFKDPQELIVGNFDSDAFADVVFTSAGTKSLMFMGNNGAGGFNSYNNIFYPTFTALPNGSTSGDFNGDGKTDVVSSNVSTTSFSLFSGNGLGDFTFVASTSAGNTIAGIASGDFDGDGKRDVMTVESTSQNMVIYPGDGAGGFNVPSTLALPGNPAALKVKDLDNDGDLDAVVTSFDASAVYVYKNTAGVFSLASTLTSGLNGSNSTSISEFSGDNIPDLAICNNTNGTVRIYIGTGNCNFTSGNSVNVSSSPDMVTTGDFNGDGFNDVAVCYGTGGATNNDVSYALGNGSGSFGSVTNLDIVQANTISYIVGVDLNQDGITDIATANTGTHDVSILKGSLSGPAYQQGFFSGYKSVHIVDAYINNDLMPDLVVCNSDATGGGSSVAVLLNRSAKITNSGADSFCAGNSVTLTSTEAYSYQWNTVATSQSIVVNTSNNYTVTTGNFNNSCSSVSLPYTITVNAAPTVSGVSGNTTICASATTTLTANSSASSPSYQWFDASSGGTLLGSNANYTTPVLVSNTSYFVEVTDGTTGCVSSPRFQVDVVIGDITAPTISGCPSDMTVNVTAGTCGAVASWTSPTATDNCGAASVTQTIGLPSGSTFPVGVHNIQYTATDGASNTSTCSFNITVVDNELPVFTSCPSNITQNAVAGTCAATVSWTTPVATDNCSATVTQTSGAISGSSFSVGTSTVTYTATDPAGNTATCSFTVTVVDAQAPVITSCPSNISVNASAGICGAVASWTAPSVTDNCSGATITQTSGPASGSTFPVGVTTIVYTATDGAGLTATCTFTVTVTDNQAPTISGCPSNQTLPNTNNVCGRVVNWTAPTATDNCTGATITQTSGPASGSTFPIGVTNIVYTATDASGNTSTCSFSITITDTQNPTIVGLPSNMSVPANSGGCTGTASWTAPTATDNCSGVTITQTAGPASGSSFPSGLTTITYTATDASGNTATGSFTVNVVDNIAPVFSNCPSNITACEGTTVTFPTPTATDNCTASPTITQTAGLPSGSVFPLGVTTVIFKATDASGNFTNCTFTVTINAAPTVSFTTPDPTACENDGFINLSTGASPSGGIFSGTGVTGSSFDPGAAGPGTFSVTYTVTNGNGCSAADSDNIQVFAAPSVTFTVNDNLVCVYNAAFTLSGGSPSGGSYSGTGVLGGQFTPGSAGVGTHTITYSITDANSCTGSATDIVDVSACTSVDEISEEQMRIYPNPTNGRFVVEFNTGISTTNLQIFNSVGQMVHMVVVNGTRADIDLSSLSSGIYFIHLELNGVRQTQKIVIER